MEKGNLLSVRSHMKNPAASPLMFESDEDSKDEEEESTNNIKNGKEDESLESVAEPTKEQKILKGFQTVLMGIPPPPAFTVPQLDSREILKLWKDNQKYRVVLSPDKGKQDLVKKAEEEAKTTKWPEMTGLTHWDIYYNRSAVSEEIECLSIRYKERYVGAETASCINVLYTKSPGRTASARKRMRQLAWGHSPGRRLSHLARRRKAFSSANLCSVAGNSRDKKMVMVEIKKIGNRQTKRNSCKKTKPTPKKKAQKETSNYKRALFQSPDQLLNAKQAKTPNSRVHGSKRNLFANNSSEKKVNENGKRERTTTRRISPRKRVNRTLSFQDSQTVSQESKTHTQISLAQTPITLTGAHKQKMLWAATNALREEGMGMNHELFRPCMTVLFRTCQKLWLTKVASQDKEGSTSENMLALTKLFSAFTIKEISADPTAEHMVKVCNDIMRMAEKILNEANERPLSSSSTPKVMCSKTSEVNVSIRNIKNKHISQTLVNIKTLNSEQEKNNLDDSNNDEITPSNSTKKQIPKQTPSKANGALHLKHSSKKISQIFVDEVNGISADRSKKLSTPKRKNKLSQNKLNSPSCSSPLTRSRTLAMVQDDSICNLPDQDSDKLTVENVFNVNSRSLSDGNQRSPKSIINKGSIKNLGSTNKFELFIRKSDIPHSSTKNNFSQFDSSLGCNESKSKELETESLENIPYYKLNYGFEKDKENLGIDRLTSDSSQKINEEKNGSSHRLLSSVENTPQVQLFPTESRNRTLQLYRLSNSGGEHVDPESLQCSSSVREPPKLISHWEEKEQTISETCRQTSPPLLLPHWEQPVSGTTVSLPDSIMSHWQQMSGNSVSTSDKIMFDYEDTSYEIIFPSTNEDDTRASSICAPFDYPHLVDDSKSCFNSVFVMGSASRNSDSS